MTLPTHQPHSPLYDRYNGFHFGAIFTAAFSSRWQASFPTWRAQMQAQLDELEARVRIPEDQQTFARLHSDLMQELIAELATCSHEFKDFFVLGSASYQALALDGQESAKELRSLGRRLLATYELPKDAWDDALRAGGTACDPLRRVMRLLTRTLAKVGPEEDTCFVALPPTPEFAERHASFFAELLRACGKRALRAWGGFGGERRQEMLVQVLRRCGALLADVSDFTPGVVFKLGVARGAGARVYLFTCTPDARPPFDLDLSWVRTYTPSRPRWLNSALADGIYFLSAVDAVVDGQGETLGDASPEQVIKRLCQAERFSAEALDA